MNPAPSTLPRPTNRRPNARICGWICGWIVVALAGWIRSAVGSDPERPTPGSAEFRSVIERALAKDLAPADPSARAHFELLSDDPVFAEPNLNWYAIWYEVTSSRGTVRSGAANAAAIRDQRGLTFGMRATERERLRERPELVFGRFPEPLHREIWRRADATFGDPRIDAPTVSDEVVLALLDSTSRDDRRIGAYLASRHRMASTESRLLRLLEAVDEHGKPDVVMRGHALDALLRIGVDVEPARLSRAVAPGVETEVALLLARLDPATEGRLDALRHLRDVAPNDSAAGLLAEVLLAGASDADAVAALVDRLGVALQIDVCDPGSEHRLLGVRGGAGERFGRLLEQRPLPPRATYDIDFHSAARHRSRRHEIRNPVVDSPLRVECVRLETRWPKPSAQRLDRDERDAVARAALTTLLDDERILIGEGLRQRSVEWFGAERLREDVAAIEDELRAGHRSLVEHLIENGLLTAAHADRPALDISIRLVDWRKESDEPLPSEYR